MDASQLAVAAAAFALGGVVKGVIGLGLPTVALAVLGTMLGPGEALPLVVVPTFLTNVWQALAGGALGALLRRLWPLLLASVPGVALGAALHLRAGHAALDLMLGAALCVYALLGLTGATPPAPGRAEPIAGPAVGLATGLVAGATGTLVLPLVPYLVAIGLGRDALVQAMGLSFALSTLTLAAALAAEGAAEPGGLAFSALAVAPAMLGMLAGQAVRRRIEPARFRRWLSLGLLVLGGNLLRRALVG